MKVYCYTQEEIQRALVDIQPQWYECPTTLERTTNPAEADCFFIPLQVGILEMRLPERINGVLPTLARLPYWNRYEAKHFFFMHSDEDTPIRTSAIVFRWSVDKNRKDPRTITMPAPVEDLGYMTNADYEQLLFHICFVGYDDDPQGIRRRCIQSLSNCSQLNCYLNPIDEPFGAYEGTYKGEVRRKQFLDAIKQSRLILAPRGHGQHSYRPIEACSAGRVPVIIADDWQLPFEGELVDWSNCAFFVEEADAECVADKILEINGTTSLDKMKLMAEAGRWYFDRWMRRERWGEATLRYLEKML